MSEAERDAVAGVLRWSVTPWRRQRGRAAGVAAFVLLAALGAWWLSGRQAVFGLVALVLLWGSVGSFYTTTRYVVDAEGVGVDSPFLKRRRRWSELRSWYPDARGITVSPFSGPHWLESYRSIRLLVDPAVELAELSRILEARLGPAGGAAPRAAGGGS